MSEYNTEGIVFDIQRFSYQDGPGIRTTVFLKGCPLRCAWCHNPESQKMEPQTMTDFSTGESKQCGSKVTADKVIKEVLCDKDFFEESGGGITVSGGEPTMQVQFSHSILEGCKKYGIHTAMETCGFCKWETIKSLRKVVDLFLYDIKLLTPDLHIKWTGVDNTPILDNLIKLRETGCEIIVRMPLVPGVNDGDEFLKVVRFLNSNELTKFTIIPYHEIWHSKYKQLGYNKEPPSFRALDKKEIERYRKIAQEHNLEIID